MLLGCPTIQCHLPVHPCLQPRVTHSHGTKRQSKLCVLASFSPVRFFLLPIKFLTFSHQNSLKNNAFPSPTPRVSQVAQRVIALGAKVTLGSWKQPCVWQLRLKQSACLPRVPGVALPGTRPARTHRTVPKLHVRECWQHQRAGNPQTGNPQRLTASGMVSTQLCSRRTVPQSSENEASGPPGDPRLAP